MKSKKTTKTDTDGFVVGQKLYGYRTDRGEPFSLIWLPFKLIDVIPLRACSVVGVTDDSITISDGLGKANLAPVLVVDG